jgi:hypothetical protein
MASIGPKTSAMQQFRNLSQEFCKKKNMQHEPKPRFQFIVDLQAWLQEKISQSYEVILCLDANEGCSGKSGQFDPLEYTLYTLIMGKGHDGTLVTFIRSCGLRDPLSYQHPGEKTPPKYNRGKDRIDCIFTTPKVLDSAIRSGLFPYDSIYLGDHRAYFLDIDSRTLYQEVPSIMAPPQYRGLQTHDSRNNIKNFFNLISSIIN